MWLILERAIHVAPKIFELACRSRHTRDGRSNSATFAYDWRSRPHPAAQNHRINIAQRAFNAGASGEVGLVGSGARDGVSRRRTAGRARRAAYRAAREPLLGVPMELRPRFGKCSSRSWSQRGARAAHPAPIQFRAAQRARAPARKRCSFEIFEIAHSNRPHMPAAKVAPGDCAGESRHGGGRHHRAPRTRRAGQNLRRLLAHPSCHIVRTGEWPRVRLGRGELMRPMGGRHERCMER